MMARQKDSQTSVFRNIILSLFYVKSLAFEGLCVSQIFTCNFQPFLYLVRCRQIDSKHPNFVIESMSLFYVKSLIRGAPPVLCQIFICTYSNPSLKQSCQASDWRGRRCQNIRCFEIRILSLFYVKSLIRGALNVSQILYMILFPDPSLYLCKIMMARSCKIQNILISKMNILSLFYG